MAKKSMIEKNKTRIRLSNLDLVKRKALKDIIMNKKNPNWWKVSGSAKTSKNEKKWSSE